MSTTKQLKELSLISRDELNVEDGSPIAAPLIGPIWHICFVANNFVFPIYAQFESAHNISRMEFVVLYCLSHRKTLFATDIARMTGLPKNNISRGVMKLEDKGLLERVTDPVDARRVHLQLNKKGRDLFAKLGEEYKNRADSYLNLLTPAEVRTLSKLTYKLVQGMDAAQR